MTDNEDCDHEWKYVDHGYNYAGYYWHDRICKKCGKKETEWCD